jgi:hypothetical protein
MIKLTDILKEVKIQPSGRVKAEVYPFQASEEKKELYDNLATKLYALINDISKKLNISRSNIRISCDYLYKPNPNNTFGLVVQIKTNNDSWKEPWAGNNYIMQSLSEDGIIIGDSRIEQNDRDDNSFEEINNLYLQARRLNLRQLVKDFNTKIKESLTDEEISSIAPNTPIIITGK